MAATDAVPAPKKRPRGHGVVSLVERKKPYAADYIDLKTGKKRRATFLTDAEAQAFLDQWVADRSRLRLAKSEQAEQEAERVAEIARKPTSTRTFGDVLVLYKQS